MKYFYIPIFIPLILFAAFENAERSELFLSTSDTVEKWSCRTIAFTPFDYSFLNQFEFQLSYRTSKSLLRGGVSTSGDPLYRESTFHVQLSYSLRYNSIYSALVKYYYLQIKNYGSAGCVGLGLSGSSKLTASTNLTVAFYNLWLSSGNSLAEEIPQIFRIRLDQRLPSKQTVSYIFEKEGYFSSGHYVFWSFSPLKNIIGRLGYASNPQEIVLGGSLTYHDLKLDCNVELNRVIGPVLVIGLTYD